MQRCSYLTTQENPVGRCSTLLSPCLTSELGSELLPSGLPSPSLSPQNTAACADVCAVIPTHSAQPCALTTGVLCGDRKVGEGHCQWPGLGPQSNSQ